MPSPCGGCPPCCPKCTFSPTPAAQPARAVELVSKEDYGCVRPDGGAVVLAGGVLGMMRAGSFHPVTQDGAAFLRESGNRLAEHC